MDFCPSAESRMPNLNFTRESTKRTISLVLVHEKLEKLVTYIVGCRGVAQFGGLVLGVV